MANVWPDLRTAQWTKVWNPSHLTKPDPCFSRVVSHFPIFVVQGAWWLEMPPRLCTGPHFLPPRICMKENTHTIVHAGTYYNAFLLANSWVSPFRAIVSYWLTSGTKLHCFHLFPINCLLSIYSMIDNHTASHDWTWNLHHAYQDFFDTHLENQQLRTCLICWICTLTFPGLRKKRGYLDFVFGSSECQMDLHSTIFSGYCSAPSHLFIYPSFRLHCVMKSASSHFSSRNLSNVPSCPLGPFRFSAKGRASNLDHCIQFDERQPQVDARPKKPKSWDRLVSNKKQRAMVPLKWYVECEKRSTVWYIYI